MSPVSGSDAKVFFTHGQLETGRAVQIAGWPSEDLHYVESAVTDASPVNVVVIERYLLWGRHRVLTEDQFARSAFPYRPELGY